MDTDTIQYESIDLSTGVHTGPFTVLAETPGAWDADYTCNPKMVRGTFGNPLGDGQTYTYALYYVGSSKGINYIGVAFSNDGINFKKYPTPVISPVNYSGGYGAAQPVPYNTDGQQAISVFYEEDSPPYPADHHWQADSSDGVHFHTLALITTNGLGLVTTHPTWADMAFNKADGYWYALYNIASRPLSTTGGILEYGQWGYQLYKIPRTDLLTGKIGWQEVKTFDTNLTGYESNFLAGLLGDGYGSLFNDGTGTVHIFPSFSNPQVAWNASPVDEARRVVPDTWDIGSASWSPTDSPLYTLNRYANGSVRWVTTGWIDPSVFRLDRSLGQIYTSPQKGATVALYGCKSGKTDQFVSLDPACEGSYIVGLNGYLFAEPHQDVKTAPLYRCSTPSGHSASNDPRCEGSSNGELLGYVLAPNGPA